MTNKKPFYYWLFFSILFLIFTHGLLQSQDNHNLSGHFRSPLDMQLYLSGTFGELRSNHFHSGIDIKTGGSEGKAVHAIAEGYVSRIKVSTGGYGKVIYIAHPNGYMSVYGHLQRFNDTLQRFVKGVQYRRESYMVEIFPKKDQFTVRKGEVIGFSGNTGSSSAPHLHFEIRREDSQHPVNPLLFDGIYVDDTYSPRIKELVIYPVNKQSRINGKNDTVFYLVQGKGIKHFLKGNPKITVSGNISFGIRTYDPMDDIPNKNGIYHLAMWVDSLQVFGLEMDELSFATSHYINSLIDYNYFQKKKRRVIRTQVDTNNRLSIYQKVTGNGIFNFNKSAKHKVIFMVNDVYGNTSSLMFDLYSLPFAGQEKQAVTFDPAVGTFFDFRKAHRYAVGNIRLSFPADAFYRSFYFTLDSLPTDTMSYSPVYLVHDRFTPVQKSFQLSVRPVSVPEKYKSQIYIAYLDEKGKSWFVGADRDKGWLTTKTNLFGKYVILADTVSSAIESLNIAPGKSLTRQKSIMMKISDDETGIQDYRATLNGKWILMEYEPKKDLLTYHIDDRLRKGANTFMLVVRDRVGNESVYKAQLVY